MLELLILRVRNGLGTWANFLDCGGPELFQPLTLSVPKARAQHAEDPSLNPLGGTLKYFFFKNGGQKIPKLILYGIPGTLAEQNIKI